MKLRFPISLPRRDNGTMLPAVLAGLLLCGVALQLLWTGNIELPPETVAHIQPVREDIAMSAEAVSPVIEARALFSPSRSGAGGANPADASPLGGVVVAGTLSRGRARLAFLKMPDGSVQRLAIGGEVSGWRLTALTTESAKFARSGESMTVAFGSTAPVIASARKNENGEDDDE